MKKFLFILLFKDYRCSFMLGFMIKALVITIFEPKGIQIASQMLKLKRQEAATAIQY